MSDQEPLDLMRTLLDRNAQPGDRADAARRLAKWHTRAVLHALLQVAQEDDADESVGRAAGESVAKVLIRRGELDQEPLFDFGQAAYIGYDEVVAHHLRSISQCLPAGDT